MYYSEDMKLRVALYATPDHCFKYNMCLERRVLKTSWLPIKRKYDTRKPTNNEMVEYLEEYLNEIPK